MTGCVRNVDCKENNDQNHKSLLEDSYSISKRRYQVASKPTTNFPLSFSTWQEDWHERLWNELSQSQNDRSLEETKDTTSTTTSKNDVPLFVKLEDEAAITSLLDYRGKIYYPHPAKKESKRIKTHKTAGIVVPLPDIGPPPKWKVGSDVAKLERDYPFGGALPKLQEGTEVNLKTKKSFHPKRKDRFHKFLNWATTENPDQVPLVHDVFDQVRVNLKKRMATTVSV